MFISDALAQSAEAATQGATVYGSFAQIAIIFVIFYLLLLRPQQKKFKQHEEMLSKIQKGDKVVTGGGLFAKVIDANDAIELTLEIAEGVIVKANRATIKDVVIAPVIENVKKEAKKPSKVANSNTKAKK